jgi:hypothetical protein
MAEYETDFHGASASGYYARGWINTAIAAFAQAPHCSLTNVPSTRHSFGSNPGHLGLPIELLVSAAGCSKSRHVANNPWDIGYTRGFLGASTQTACIAEIRANMIGRRRITITAASTYRDSGPPEWRLAEALVLLFSNAAEKTENFHQYAASLNAVIARRSTGPWQTWVASSGPTGSTGACYTLAGEMTRATAGYFGGIAYCNSVAMVLPREWIRL